MLTVAAFYRFTPFPNPAELKPPLEAVCRAGDVKGSILLANEGLNGTICGPRAGIDAALAHIRALPGCAALEWKESEAAAPVFGRLKIRLKKEIVTFGEETDPAAQNGVRVPPAEWNALISRDDVAVIDTRNDYETDIGVFKGAVRPETGSFREFPDWWREHEDEFRGKKVAMYCTGGIRCEKTTSWLLSRGVKDVFHLEGGILKYLEDVPEEASLWEGGCFVFDERVSVGHGVTPDGFAMCKACGRAIREDTPCGCGSDGA